MIDVVDLSRLQFAMTAMYHFLFVPLTLGMAFLLAIMESVYVMTGKQIYKDMTKFWGKLFGINFALGVATGLTMEFQFGTNWSYYSHYVGDIFGAPLAIEALIAFFLESTMVGLFFFGWDRLSKRQHLTVTWLVAIGSSNTWFCRLLGSVGIVAEKTRSARLTRRDQLAAVVLHRSFPWHANDCSGRGPILWCRTSLAFEHGPDHRCLIDCFDQHWGLYFRNYPS